MSASPEPDTPDLARLVPLHSADIAQLQWKARLLMLFIVSLLVVCVLFVMYARGAFEATQRLVLVAEDSEGVVIGMDLTFAGFPIGRVAQVELAPDGRARILVDVVSKDAHWLRTSSIFTLVKGLVGAPSIRAYSGILTDPALPDNAERTVLQGDTSAEIPKLMATTRELVENLAALTQPGGPAASAMANLQTTTEKLNGPGGAMTVLLGGEAQARKVTQVLERTNQLLARMDSLAGKADTQVFGDKGMLPSTQATVEQMNALLGDARNSLRKVDALLQDAQAISANAKDASAELGTLRAEVDASLRRVQGLMNDFQAKWPFARDTAVELP